MLCAKLVNMFLVTRLVGWKACTAGVQVAPTWRGQLLYCRTIDLPFRETLTNCLVVRNLTKFNKCEGLGRGLNKPWQPCKSVCWLVRRPLCSKELGHGGGLITLKRSSVSWLFQLKQNQNTLCESG